MNALAADNSQIRAVIRELFAAKFPHAELVRIQVRSKMFDAAEKEEVEIGLVIKAKKSDFSPSIIPAFMTAVVAKLEEIDESRFPIISFISESDKRKRSTAAA